MNLPLATRVLLWLADFFQQYGLWVLVGIILLGIIERWATKLNFIKPFWHQLILQMPYFNGIAREINLARFNRSLGSLLHSGLPITKALKTVLLAIENISYKRGVQKILHEIERGSALTDALKKQPKLFPPITQRLVQAAEESGQLEDTLFYLARYYEQEVSNRMKNISVIIEPALLIIIGVIVGFVGISIVSPIYQITSRLGQ